MLIPRQLIMFLGQATAKACGGAAKLEEMLQNGDSADDLPEGAMDKAAFKNVVAKCRKHLSTPFDPKVVDAVKRSIDAVLAGCSTLEK